MNKSSVSEKVAMEQKLAHFLKKADDFYTYHGHIKQIKKNIRRLFHAAFTYDFIIKKSRFQEMHRFEKALLEFLVSAHYTYKEGAFSLVSPEEFPFLDNGEARVPAYFDDSRSDRFSPWNFYPRHLNKREFINPVLAIDSCFKFKDLEEWKTIFAELFDAALSDDCLTSFSLEDNPIKIYDYSFKLLEAGNLIKIREK